MKRFSLEKIPKQLLYTVVFLLSIGIFIGHVKLIETIQSYGAPVSEKKKALMEEISPGYKKAGIDEEIFVRSERGAEYVELKKEENSWNSIVMVFLSSLIIWPFIITGIGVRKLNFYWHGRKLSPPALELRRYQSLLFGSIFVAGVFFAAAILWRFQAVVISNRRLSVAVDKSTSEIFWLLWTTVFVVALGETLIHLLWYLFLSPVGRFRINVKTFSPIYRSSAQFMLVAIVLFITAYDLSGVLKEIYLLSIQSVAGLFLFAALSGVMVGYLRVPFRSGFLQDGRADGGNGDMATTELDSAGIPKDLNAFSARIEKLIALLENPDSRGIESTDRNTGSQKKYISGELIRKRANLIEQRLMDEVKSLTKRGNVNLAIGSATSLMAAAILLLLVTRDHSSLTEMTAMLSYYLPRISVAIFIEIFAFFFLRLYKNGLSEIMYYQNELTSLETKMLALEIATCLPSKDILHQILQNFAKTDRNFILKAGESTIELEKIKADQQNISTLFDTLLSNVTNIKDSLKIAQ